MCGVSFWPGASVPSIPGSLILFPLLVLLLSVVPRSREGGGRRTFFASFLYKPVRARRSYKTKTYHVRKRFTTALLMFNIVTHSTVTWAGTVDQGRSLYTKKQPLRVRRRPKPAKTTRPKASSRRETQRNDRNGEIDHGGPDSSPTLWIYEPTLFPEGPDRWKLPNGRLSQCFGNMDELIAAIQLNDLPRQTMDPIAQFRAIKELGGGFLHRTRKKGSRRVSQAMIAAIKLSTTSGYQDNTLHILDPNAR